MAKKTATKTARTARKASVRSQRGRNNVFAARNNREKGMICAIIALAILLIGSIGVAVAAFSTDLYIRGTATVSSSVWDVHFENLQPAQLTGTYAQEITAPTIQTSVDGVAAAAIKNYDVKLKEPGDAVEYTFDVINAGDMDAVISAIQMNTGSDLSCTSAAGADVAAKVCAKLNYTLTYADGTAVAAGDKLPNQANGTNTKMMKLKLELDPSITSNELPEKDVAISGLAVIISYAQDI